MAVKKAYILIGPPAVGKSRWRVENLPRAHVINRDEVVEDFGKRHGLSYEDMFALPPRDATAAFCHPGFGGVVATPRHWIKNKVGPGLGFLDPEQIFVYRSVRDANFAVEGFMEHRVSAGAGHGEVVIDMTNMNVAARKKNIDNFRLRTNGHELIAVVFPFQGVEDLIQEIAGVRAEIAKLKGRAKNIPAHVFKAMFEKYEPPRSEEGFADIVQAYTGATREQNRVEYKKRLESIKQELLVLTGSEKRTGIQSDPDFAGPGNGKVKTMG